MLDWNKIETNSMVLLFFWFTFIYDFLFHIHKAHETQCRANWRRLITKLVLSLKKFCETNKPSAVFTFETLQQCFIKSQPHLHLTLLYLRILWVQTKVDRDIISRVILLYKFYGSVAFLIYCHRRCFCFTNVEHGNIVTVLNYETRIVVVKKFCETTKPRAAWKLITMFHQEPMVS